MENRKRNILFSEEQIQEKVKELGAQITKDYQGKEIYILPLLRGSFVFGADIFKAIDLKAKIGFMTTSSYGNSEISSGTVTVVNDIPDNIEGLDVLIVDDIIAVSYTHLDVYKRQHIGKEIIIFAILLLLCIIPPHNYYPFLNFTLFYIIYY